MSGLIDSQGLNFGTGLIFQNEIGTAGLNITPSTPTSTEMITEAGINMVTEAGDFMVTE